WAYSLLAVIGMILFFPKVLSIVLIVLKRRTARAYGGVARLTVSVLLEILLSSLLAPIRMVFHSRFVVLNLLGRTVAWHSEERGAPSRRPPSTARARRLHPRGGRALRERVAPRAPRPPALAARDDPRGPPRAARALARGRTRGAFHAATTRAPPRPRHGRRVA